MNVDSILCAPIILHHRVIGVIQVQILYSVAPFASIMPRSLTSRSRYPLN